MTVPQYSDSNMTQRVRRLIDEIKDIRVELANFENGAAKVRDAPPLLPLSDRGELIDIAKELVDDLVDPYTYWMDVASSYMETTAYDVFMRFRLYEKLPRTGSVPVKDLATAANIDEDRLSRILRLLTMRFCVAEPQPGHFAHTATSRWLLSNNSVAAYVETSLDTFHKAASSLVEAFSANPAADAGGATGFTERFNEQLYEYWDRHTEKMQRFQTALHDNRLVQEAVNSFPWETLEGKVVDVGGGNGQIALQVVQSHPQLDFVVQDSFVNADRVKMVESLGLSGRLKYMTHDYYQPQPVQDASAFFLKHCLHNNDDYNCIRILKALIPALESGPASPVLLVSEFVLPEWNDENVSRDLARQLYNADMAMMVLFNAKERDAAQYQALLTAADPRLKIVKIHHIENDRLSTMEVHLVKE